MTMPRQRENTRLAGSTVQAAAIGAIPARKSSLRSSSAVIDWLKTVNSRQVRLIIPMEIMIKTVSLALLLISAMVVQAQNIDSSSEVVARVNDDVITKADLLIALNEYEEQVAERTRQLTEGATVDSEALKQIVLDTLIDGLLLEQKATELGLDTESEIDEIINNSALMMPPGYRDAFDANGCNEALTARRVGSEQSKASLRRRILQQSVIQREVLAPIYAQISGEDRRDYYDSHNEEFKVPARVKLSEIFLRFDNNSETSVEEHATQLLASLRSGADFVGSVRENTPPSRSSWAMKGYLGSFALEELRESVVIATSTLKPCEFTEPIRDLDGYMIIRLDGRIDATLRSYDDPAVQLEISRLIVLSRAEGALRDYVLALRKSASIVLSTR